MQYHLRLHGRFQRDVVQFICMHNSNSGTSLLDTGWTLFITGVVNLGRDLESIPRTDHISGLARECHGMLLEDLVECRYKTQWIPGHLFLPSSSSYTCYKVTLVSRVIQWLELHLLFLFQCTCLFIFAQHNHMAKKHDGTLMERVRMTLPWSSCPCPLSRVVKLCLLLEELLTNLLYFFNF